jgi:NADPH:quinone reductase-like Zn-dependent oxidoreductase
MIRRVHLKAIVQERFGPPDVLQLIDVDTPEPGADEVLVQVKAAALNPADWHILRGDPLVARLMGIGLTKPKDRVAGSDAAGVVESIGANVRGVQPGDEVLGFFKGAFAEYACAKSDVLVPKPASLTFEQAAAVPIAATTALRGIRDTGEVKTGQRVLINGAGGGVGTVAVQIAVAMGAEVTGVCSTRNVELVRSLGAANVIDYTAEDFTAGSVRYDVILDNVSNLPLAQLRRVLTPKGILVLNGGGSPGHVFGPVGGILKAVVVNLFVSQRLRPLPSKQKREELLAVTELIEGGKVTPVVDATYPLADTAEGLRQVELGHTRGKAVITVP